MYKKVFGFGRWFSWFSRFEEKSVNYISNCGPEKPTINQIYTTKEFKIPTKNTRKIQRLAPEKTICFDEAQPSAEAKTTGTPTTKAKDNAINANKVSWNRKSILKLIEYKI